MAALTQDLPTVTPEHRLIGLIRSARIDLSSEKRAQADIAVILERAGIAFQREVRLSAEDIVDFMSDGVALEVKLKGARKKGVYRQLCRYAKHPSVQSIVLASSESMGLPKQIDGKDAYFLKLGEGWL